MPTKQPMTNTLGPTDWQYDWIRSGVFKAVVAHFFFGLRSDIPWCCSLEFSLLRFWKKYWGATAVSCGGNRRCTSNYVHCFYHRHKFHPGRTSCDTSAT